MNKGICKACNTKTVQLSTMFNGWPLPLFGELSAEAQVAFWQADTKDKAGVMTKLSLDLTEVREKRESEKKGGKFLPLSVYATMGYGEAELANIAKNCTREFDETLDCDTFRLDVKELVHEQVKSEVQKELLSLRDSSLRGKLSHYRSPLKGKRKRSSSSSNSSNSSSSSGSSAADPRKNKGKLAAKAKKEARREAVKTAAAKKEAATQKQAMLLEAKRNKIAASKEEKAAKAAAAKEAKAQAKQDQKDSISPNRLCM